MDINVTENNIINISNNIEAQLLFNNNFLITLDDINILTPNLKTELEYILQNFCGVVKNIGEFNSNILTPDSVVYLCGDIENIVEQIDLTGVKKINILSDFSTGVTFNILTNPKYNLVTIGQVPINVCGVGVFFPELFTDDTNYFDSITNEHEFQTLTESNKPSNAFRTGIYLTPVKKLDNDPNSLEFNLLRCSSNLAGPTDNFRPTDINVVNKINEISSGLFSNPANLNHILAQTYHNSKDGNKEKKAKIKDHSDKTKDMPINGIMAFCSFYEGYNSLNKFNGKITQSTSNRFDYCYNETSVFTKLRFRLKECVKNNDNQLVSQFDLTLYPNSVFLMSLSTNRLYTHEIIPSSLPVDKIPTRMGYVIRCSKTQAIHTNGKTWIKEGTKLVEMVEPYEEGVNKLKNLYWKENVFSNMIQYDKFYFSLNQGDYMEPLV